VSPAPTLGGEAFERAFPFHLQLDESLAIRHVGHSLLKAVPALQPGLPLGTLFDVRRPSQAARREDWLRHGTALCTLSTRVPARPLTLRGAVEPLDDGGLLLLLTPVITSLEALRALGLGFDDFARHDGVGEMLLLARTTQTSVADSLRMAERLRRRTAVLDGILELSPNGVLAFDGELKLQHANSAVLHLLGVAREQLARRSLAEVQALLAERSEPAERDTFDLTALCEGGRTTLRLVVPRPRVLELRGCRAPDGGRTVYLRDMTAEFEIDRMKSEFLTTAAHELRTPMASIYGFAELLLHRPVSEGRRRDALETIHRQAQLLIGMLGELLDLARIEARQGKDLNRQAQPLGPLVSDAVQAINGGALIPRVKLLLAHGDEAVLVDGAKTQRALLNVLHNALQFSEGDRPVVVDTLMGWVEDGPALGVRITDAGIGMTPEQIARCCERFWRGDPSGHRPGSGLGLSLVKEITELQGGRVDIASQPGVGTTVTLWLPCAQAQRQGPQPAAANDPARAPHAA
jgi:signal transduction histidine kinase